MKQFSTWAGKIQWLLNNQDVWLCFPSADKRNHHKTLFKAMQKAGLYHPKTEWFTADIDRLVSEARKQRALSQITMELPNLPLGTIRCQFCYEPSKQNEWKNDTCPKCGRKYDVILAIDSETE